MLSFNLLGDGLRDALDPKHKGRMPGGPGASDGVTSQIILTGRLIANNQFSIALKKWNSLTPAQQQRVQAAAGKFSDAITNQALKDESELQSAGTG